MLPVKVTDRGVLIIRLQADLDIGRRATTACAIDRVLAAHRSSPVVLELTDAALSPAGVSTVVRALRMCRDAGTASAVVTASADARRTLGTGAGAQAPDVHATLPLAVTALSATVGAAA
ncbi:STAS domain-containing protein [Streptomyces sp. NBC_01232]|uniref:STAS domain-containing protein n=1 Tax=unclassified Streptomyces TaxID=2593676 RepID=UPI002E1042E0|nr:STAS domain-containing protein [Streptomyces sp. NBC_01232]